MSREGSRPIQSHPSFEQWNTDKTWAVLDECQRVAEEKGATVPQVTTRIHAVATRTFQFFSLFFR